MSGLAGGAGSVYEDGAYEDVVDYRRDPPPPLSADDLEWLYLRLRQLGRR